MSEKLWKLACGVAAVAVALVVLCLVATVCVLSFDMAATVLSRHYCAPSR